MTQYMTPRERERSPIKNMFTKKMCAHIIHNSHRAETSQMSINWWISKVRIPYSRMLIIQKRNEVLLLLLPVLAQLVARSLCVWYLFCERVAEETPELTMAIEKPKDGVKTENSDYIYLKMVGQNGSVVQYKIKRHTQLNESLLWHIRFPFEEQPINETDPHIQ